MKWICGTALGIVVLLFPLTSASTLSLTSLIPPKWAVQSLRALDSTTDVLVWANSAKVAADSGAEIPQFKKVAYVPKPSGQLYRDLKSALESIAAQKAAPLSIPEAAPLSKNDYTSNRSNMSQQLALLHSSAATLQQSRTTQAALIEIQEKATLNKKVLRTVSASLADLLETPAFVAVFRDVIFGEWYKVENTLIPTVGEIKRDAEKQVKVFTAVNAASARLLSQRVQELDSALAKEWQILETAAIHEEKRLQAATRALEQRASKWSTLAHNRDIAREGIKEMESELSSQQDSFASLKRNIQAKANSIASHKRRIRRRIDEITKAENDFRCAGKGKHKVWERKNGTLACKRDETIALRKRIKKKNKEITRRRGDINELRSEIKELRNRAFRIETKISELQRNITKAKDTVAAINKTLAKESEQLRTDVVAHMQRTNPVKRFRILQAENMVDQARLTAL